jgi:hypothetical protein
MCYIQFGAYPNHVHIQILAKKKLVGKKRKTEKKNNSTDQGLILGFADLMPNC